MMTMMTMTNGMTSTIAATTRTIVNASCRNHRRPSPHRPFADRSLFPSSSSRASSSSSYLDSGNIAATSRDDDEDDDDDAAAATPARNPHYPRMFEPLYLGPHIGYLPNRVIMGSMHTGLEGHSMPRLLERALDVSAVDENRDGGGLTRMARYFEERARGGVGLMVTGGIAPNRRGWVGPFAGKLTTETERDRHRVVTDAVHSVRIPTYRDTSTAEDDVVAGYNTEPGRICLQILHTGRYAYHPFAVSATSTKSPISPFPARGMSSSEVRSTVRDFANCAYLARGAGYDGVEIMGSEGYLINQFLSTRTNRRNDEYGGSFVNRMRFALDVVNETRAACGLDFIIIFRLSMLDLVNDGSSWDEIKTLAQALEDAGVTIINTGIGWHEARIPTIATSVPRGAFSFVTKKLRDEKVVSVPLCATNRINAPSTVESILGSGSADLVSMARPFLADPDIVRKSREGRDREINTCIACNQACLDHAFVAKTASCLVNPRACHETELSIEPDSVRPEDKLNIGVIGSGPAGMSFAYTAATIGHHVTLFEKSNEIGGQFNMAKRIPGKEEFHETIRYFTVQLEKLKNEGKLDMRLGTEISYSEMELRSSDDYGGRKIDKWIIATGVDPRVPKIPGLDHPSVLSYIDVLRNKAKVGRRVAVIGAGGIGFDISEYLLHHDDSDDHDMKAHEVDTNEFLKNWGVDKSLGERGGLLPEEKAEMIKPRREIILMQRKKGKLGAGLGKTTGWIHRSTLARSNCVEMLSEVSYEMIDKNGHLHITFGNGDKKKSRVLEVDNIVLCAGQTSKKDLEKAAIDKGCKLASKVFTIGGAYEAGELDAKRAIDMGTRLALRIEDNTVLAGQHAFSAGVGAEEKLYKTMMKMMR